MNSKTILVKLKSVLTVFLIAIGGFFGLILSDDFSNIEMVEGAMITVGQPG